MMTIEVVAPEKQDMSEATPEQWAIRLAPLYRQSLVSEDPALERKIKNIEEYLDGHFKNNKAIEALALNIALGEKDKGPIL